MVCIIGTSEYVYHTPFCLVMHVACGTCTTGVHIGRDEFVSSCTSHVCQSRRLVCSTGVHKGVHHTPLRTSQNGSVYGTCNWCANRDHHHALAFYKVKGARYSHRS